jgi:hypothetical protein
VSTPAQNTSGPGPWNDFNPVQPPSLFDDSSWMSNNMDLTYDIPADDMQANYEYEAYGGSRGPDWSFNPIPPNTTPSEPNRTPSPVNTTGRSSAATVANAVPTTPVLTSKVFRQRTPSGTIYAPDLSAYNDSSLFNYTGPGGLDEYTYGQGLRTGGADYSIFGTPADVANPYYEGQFGEGYTEPAGVADAAINMPAVELPEGVQPVNPEVSADVSMPAFNGITPRPPSSAGDLTYQQTIDEMGIFGPDNPPPSTMFPSPNNTEASLFLTPEQQAILAEQNRMQQGQISNATIQPPAIDEIVSNYINDQAATDEIVSNYIDSQPTVQSQADQLQNMADQMALNLTKEELRDGLFIEPTFSRDSDGNFVGKMGIPDTFLQDKTPIESEADYSFNDSMLFNQPLTQAEMDNQDLYQGNDGNYYKNYDDLGTQPVTPEPVAGPKEETLNEIYDDIARLENDTKFNNMYAEVLKEVTDFTEARTSLVNKQTAAQAEAQARAQAEAAAQAREQARLSEQARARAQAEAAAQAKAKAEAEEKTRQAAAQAAAQAKAKAEAEEKARQAAAQAKAKAKAEEKARQAAAAQKRMNDRYETGPVARAPTSAPRPSAPAGGYSTKQRNNSFSTRRDIRNIFA